MQITLTIPDGLPESLIQQEIKKFEAKLNKFKKSFPKNNENDLKIDAHACLNAFAKIKQGDRSQLTEIGNIDEYIENLRNEIIEN